MEKNKMTRMLQLHWIKLNRRIQCLGAFGVFTCSIAIIALVLGLLYPMTTTQPDASILIDAFAQTITQKNIQGNVALFAPNGSISFHRLMRFLVPSTSLNPLGWASQLQTIMSTFRTNHMTFSNYNVTQMNKFDTRVYALGYYTWTFDNIDPTVRLTTVVSSFSVEFWIKNQQIYRAEALANATNTVISSQLFGSGVSPPGPLLNKRSTHLMVEWETLLLQIESLIFAGQVDQARAICQSQYYALLAQEFDPMGNSSNLICNNLPPDSTVDLGILTVNQIHPFMGDFTIIGGFGVNVTGGTNSITIDSFMDIKVPPEFESILMNGKTYFVKLNQSGNTFYAGPADGSTNLPVFRSIVEEDIPLLNASANLYGILPVELGGTGHSGSDFIVGGSGINVTFSNSTYFLELVDNGVIQVQLEAPTDLFSVLSAPVTFNGSHVFEPINQQSNHIWAGPISGSADRPSFRLLTESDIPLLDASVKLSGILPVDRGGTNNGGPLTGDRIIISTPSSIVEGELVAGTGISVSLNGGTLEIDNTGLIYVPSDLFQLTPNNSFVSIEQSVSHVWIGNTFGPPTFRLLEKSDLPLLNASVVEGGTGRTDLFSAYRMLLSNAQGDKIVESGILNNGDLIIGQSGSSPVVGQITAAPGGEIIVTPLAGKIEIALGNILSSDELTVTGSTFLGTNTTCIEPLDTSCYDISNQECSTGPLNQNCLPSNITLFSLTVQDLTVLNATVLGTVIDQEFLNVTNLMAENFSLANQMTCSMSNSISQDCFDISGKICSMGNALSESCIPANLVMFDMDVTNNLTVNNVKCNAGALDDTCIPLRLASISGIHANSSSLDFNLVAGLGISLTPIPNGLSIGNTGQLVAPVDLFSTNGLTFKTNLQAPNTVWAGPVTGNPAVPAFRQLQIADLPGLSPGQIYYGNHGAVNLTSVGSIFVDDYSIPGTLVLNGTGLIELTVPPSILTVDYPNMNEASISLINQLGNTVFAGPDGSTGLPTFRSLEMSDLPVLPIDQLIVGTGSGLIGATLNAGTGISIGSNLTIENTGVTSVSLSAPPSIFSVSGSPVIGTGTLSFDLVSQPKHTFLAGTSTLPTFRALELADLPALPPGGIYMSNGTNLINGSLIGGSGITVTNDGIGSITLDTDLTSVGLSVPSSEFTIANSPLSTSGTLVLGKAEQAANSVWAGPLSGANAEPNFRYLGLADFQGLNLEDGQLLIGNSGGPPSAANLMAGSNVVITNTPGGIIISASTNTSMTGTVMSVNLTAPSNVFSVSGGPVTSIGSLDLGFVNQAVGTVFAGPVGGSSNVPTFRHLEYADLPSGLVSNLTAGSGIQVETVSGSTVVSSTMSVGLSISGPLFTISESPVTASGGTLTASLNNQAARTFLAAPSASVGLPSFRTIGLADLPPLNNGQLYIGQGGNVVASGLAAGSGITISTGPGTITISATPTNCFGEGFQYVRDTETTAVTSNLWSLRQRLTTGTLPSGTYRVEFIVIYMTSQGGASTTAAARLLLNGNNNAFFNGQIFAKNIQGPSSSRRASYTGFDFFTGSGVNEIDLEISRLAGNQEIQVLFSSISIWRVA